MAHRTRIRPNMAAWANNSAILQSEIEAIDAAQFSAIDGDAGGIWSPSSKILLAGSNGLELQAPFKALASVGYNASMQAQNWPSRGTPTSAANVNSDLPIAWDNSGAMGPSSSNRYCALSQNLDSFTSEDGESWVNHGSYSGLVTGVANDIAAGLSSATPCFLATSSSGINVMRTINGGTGWATFGNTGIIGAVIAYSPSLGLWVAAGASGAVATSPDGATWTARTAPAGWISGCGGAQKIVWSSSSGGRFVIVPKGTYNKFLTSADGITWIEVATTTALWQGLAFGTFDNKWMAISASGDVWISQDGVNWFSAAPIGSYGGRGLAVYQSLWIAVTPHAAYGGIQWSTDSGHTWQKSSVSTRLPTDGWARIIAADNRFVLSAANGTTLEFALSARSS